MERYSSDESEASPRASPNKNKQFDLEFSENESSDESGTSSDNDPIAIEEKMTWSAFINDPPFSNGELFTLNTQIREHIIEQLFMTGFCDLYDLEYVILTKDDQLAVGIMNTLRLARDPRAPRDEVYRQGDDLSPEDWVWGKVYSPQVLIEAEETPDSFSLFQLFGEWKLFPSGRARTTMKKFRTSQMNDDIYEIGETIDQDLISQDLINQGNPVKLQLDDIVTSAIPVSRYVAEVSGGLHYDPPSPRETYCGTFYYHEPGSTVLLKYQNHKKFYNKIDAGITMFKTISGLNLVGDYLFSDTVFDDIRSRYTYPAFKFMLQIASSLRSVFGILPKNEKIDEDDLRFLIAMNRYVKDLSHRDSLSQIFDDYVHFMRGDPSKFYFDKRNVDIRTDEYLVTMYATEDPLDQAICEAGAHLGYDVLFLESVPGSTRVVSEILDTRPRNTSLNSLIWVY